MSTNLSLDTKNIVIQRLMDLFPIIENDVQAFDKTKKYLNNYKIDFNFLASYEQLYQLIIEDFTKEFNILIIEDFTDTFDN